jgi:hypothetical protein
LLRYQVARLCKGGFVHVESPVIFIILVPFVLRIVYFVERRRFCKVELQGNSAVRLETHQVRRASQASLTSFGAIRIMSPVESQGFDRRSAQGNTVPYFLWSSARRVDRLIPLPSSMYASHHLVHAAPRGPGKRERG